MCLSKQHVRFFVVVDILRNTGERVWRRPKARSLGRMAPALLLRAEERHVAKQSFKSLQVTMSTNS